MHESDESLMLQVSRGSPQELEHLIRRHADTLLAFCTRLLGSQHRGEEAFQEVFLAVWAGRRTYKFPGRFRPWLFRIASNKCRELMRYRGHTTNHYDREPDPAELHHARSFPTFPAPADTVIAQESHLLIEAALRKLPDRQRAVLVMRLWTGLSFIEIAEALDIKEVTVRSTMHEALHHLRRYLEPKFR